MAKSTRGNPWHDAEGKFCSGPSVHWMHSTDGEGNECIFIARYADDDREQEGEPIDYHQMTPEEVEEYGGGDVVKAVYAYYGFTKSEKTAEEYKQRTADRVLKKEQEEMAAGILSKETITREEAEAYREKLKENRDYAETLERCETLAGEYNDVAVPLQDKMVAYDRAIDEGRTPDCDYEEIRRESAEARKRYEAYKTADKEAAKHETDLREMNRRLAEQEGKNPAFYRKARCAIPHL